MDLYTMLVILIIKMRLPLDEKTNILLFLHYNRLLLQHSCEDAWNILAFIVRSDEPDEDLLYLLQGVAHYSFTRRQRIPFAIFDEILLIAVGRAGKVSLASFLVLLECKRTKDLEEILEWMTVLSSLSHLSAADFLLTKAIEDFSQIA